MSAVWEDKIEFIDTAEVHWSTGTVLAIFFASTLVSAVFFGLGYSFGRGGATQASVGFSSSIAAGAPSLQQAGPQTVGTSAEERSLAAPPRKAAHVAPVPVTEPRSLAADQHAKNATVAVRYVVQVGAIGSQKDARKLVMELRQHGIHARIYASRTDRFLHVQVGPYATSEQAQAVRRRVRASGFPAVLKHAS